MKKQLRKYKKIFVKNPKIIDVFGLLLILFVISLAYLLFNRKVEYLNVTLRLFNYGDSEYYIGGNKPRPWYVEQITPGKKQKSGLGRTLIEIIDVYNYEGPSALQDVYVTLKIRTAQNRINQQYIYNGSPLLIHDIRSFKVQDILIAGEIVDIENNENPHQRETGRFLVSLELAPQGMQLEDFNNNSAFLVEGVKNYIAESLYPGMTIKDSRENEMVVVKEIETSLGIRSWVGPSGYMETIDPNRTKVILQLEIVGEKINGYYYYRREAPLTINQGLYLMFDNVSVLGSITKIEPLLEN